VDNTCLEVVVLADREQYLLEQLSRLRVRAITPDILGQPGSERRKALLRRVDALTRSSVPPPRTGLAVSSLLGGTRFSARQPTLPLSPRPPPLLPPLPPPLRRRSRYPPTLCSSKNSLAGRNRCYQSLPSLFWRSWPSKGL
jgi:hypothetical protein